MVSLTVTRRRFSPTTTDDLAAAILAVCKQVDCDANVWGTYHYSGLETKKEIEFATQVLKYAANHDEENLSDAGPDQDHRTTGARARDS